MPKEQGERYSRVFEEHLVRCVSPQTVRVVVVKWDRFSGRMISQIAKEALGNSDVALFHRADEALSYMRSQPVDIGIFGLTLPDWDGLDLLALVANERLARRRLVATWRSDERVRHVLKRTEIHGLVETMTDGPEHLSAALSNICYGNREFRKSPARNRQLPLLDQILSPRELQVLAVLADGSDDTRASDFLGLRPTTVHTHRQRIMSKLGVQTRAELIREALRRGVIRFTDTGVLRPGLENELGVSLERSRGS